MIIRKAGMSDLDILVDFQVRMARETEDLELNKETIRHGVLSVLHDSGKGFYHVAEIEGKVIACHMVTYEWSDWRNAMFYWIQSLYVAPEHRRSGVFRKMYQYLCQRAKDLPGVAGIRLYVVHTNERAQKAYEDMGMDGDHYRMFEWIKK